MTKNELQNYINKQLLSVNNKLVNHILNVRQLPNPMYMVEPNEREMKWSDDDNEVCSKLEDYRAYLLKIVKLIKK
jgi:hypothetical protein